MKQKVGPGLIVVAVILIAGFMFGIYKLAFRSQSPPPSADNAPDYAKSAKSGNKPDYGNMYGQAPAGSQQSGSSMQGYIRAHSGSDASSSDGSR